MAIFITQNSKGKNFTSLLKFSDDIRFMVQEDCPTVGDNSWHVEKIGKELKHFNPECDMLVLVGDPINIGIALHTAMKKGGDVTVLKWDRQNSLYAKIKISNK
jgi:hypothetical protein